MTRWRCSCLICRLLVHPVLRRVPGASEGISVGHSSEATAEGAEARAELVRAAPLSGETGEETGGAVAPASPSTVAAQSVPVEEIIEGVVGKVGETLRSSFEENTKILVERLDRIEENLGRLRKELQGLVSGMENIIVEFREALSELTNPLTTPSAPSDQAISPLQPVLPGSSPFPSQPPHLISFVSTMVELLKKAGLDVVENLIRDYRDAGVLSDEEAKRLSVIARAIARLREKGVDDQTIVSIVASLMGRREG